MTTTYTLDGAGRRLAETTGASTTSFDLDLSRANPTILADGTRRYLPGDPSAGYEQAGTWYSALADQAGSPHSLVSEAGVQGTITRWDPYGAARPGSSVTSGIGYAGEWRDATGLVNLRARAYDPAAGRFTGRDGFGGLAQAPQSANRYSYAQNGPYRYADPSGRFVNAVYGMTSNPSAAKSASRVKARRIASSRIRTNDTASVSEYARPGRRRSHSAAAAMRSIPAATTSIRLEVSSRSTRSSPNRGWTRASERA